MLDMISKTIMILGASILQLPAIKEALKMGLCVVVVDKNPNAIGFKEPGIIKEVVSTIDIEGIKEAAKRNKIDGIMTLATDMPMQSVAAVAKELGLVGITEETALKATNKAYMRDALKASNVPIPKYFKVNSIKEFIKASGNFTDKCISKPADNSGSRGIYLIENVDNDKEVEFAYNYSRENSRSGEVVLEEYMTGDEVSVESITYNGKTTIIQITDKITTGAPNFVEMGHTQPTHFNEEIRIKIEEVTKAAIEAIGIESGPSHTEIKITENGPKIVELGARLGGDNITTHLVPLSTGVNMVRESIKIALGEEPNLTSFFSRGSAIRYLDQKPGIITAIKGIDDAKTIQGVQQVSIVYDIGEKLEKITSSSSRIGFVIADGIDAATAAQSCEDAKNRITIIQD